MTSQISVSSSRPPNLPTLFKEEYVAGISLPKSTGTIVLLRGLDPSTAQEERSFSFSGSCLFPGKQTKCRNIQPDREGKGTEEAEEQRLSKKREALEKVKDGVKMVTIGNSLRKISLQSIESLSKL